MMRLRREFYNHRVTCADFTYTLFLSSSTIDLYEISSVFLDATTEISKTHNSTKLYMRSHFELAINKISPINFRLFSAIVVILTFLHCSQTPMSVHFFFHCLACIMVWHDTSDFQCSIIAMASQSGSQRTNQKKPKHLISDDVVVFFRRLLVCFHYAFSASFLIQFHLFLRYIFNFLEFVICARCALSAFVFHWLLVFFQFLFAFFPFSLFACFFFGLNLPVN